MSSYEKIVDLPVVIDSCSLDLIEHDVSGEWIRCCTVIRLSGAGEAGLGEDPVYSERDQRLFQESGPSLPLAGHYTLGDFSAHLEGLELFAQEPEYPGSEHYRRWAFESAALDLALRQADTTLVDALELTAWPVQFVVSMSMSDASNLERFRQIRDEHPEMGFKLDAGPAWDETLIAELAGTGAIEVIDFKGMYEGTPVDQLPDPELYSRVAEAFPNVLLEDPRITEETRRALEAHMDRVTWDAPIHSVADIEALETPPRVINFKPSRFGTLERLFDGYDYCRKKEIAIYGGGQFELGIGRGQIQYLASLFHPNAANDVAPADYNIYEDTRTLPDSPLAASPSAKGFRWSI